MATAKSTTNVRSIRPTNIETISAKLIQLRSGNARNKARTAQSIVQVVIAATDGDDDAAYIRGALFAASDLLEEACARLDEVNIAKPANDEELAALSAQS
jgi:hypothetical protein